MTTLLIILFPIFIQPPAPGLDVVFTNIKQAKGQIYVAVYDNPGTYMNPDKARAKKVLPVSATGNLACAFPELQPGTYAISCFHDVNGNGKLDTNLLGIPTEPYGASNNARPKFRAANWAETKFEWKNDSGAISIRLEKW
mgnify:FL=1